MTIKLNKKLYLFFGLFFLLLHPFNLYILNNINNVEKILLSISIIFLIFSFGKIKKISFKYIIPWILFISFLFINRLNGVDYSFLIYHILSILFVFSLINSADDSVFEKCTLVLLVISLIHALATILLFFVPFIYNFVRPLIVSQNIMYAGYKTGLTGHYSTNAIYITIGLIISFFLLFKNRKITFKNIFLILFFLFALILTTKRGVLLFSIISIIVTFIFLFFNKLYKKKIIRICFIIFILLLIIYIFGGSTVFNNLINRFVNDGNSGRDYLNSIALDNFNAHPLFGNGTGFFRNNYKFLNNDNLISYNVHNVYIQLLCENGIIGLLLFLVPTVYTLFISIKYLRLKLINNNVFNGKIYLIALSICYQLYFLLYSLTGNTIYDNMVFIPYYIFCSYIYYLVINYSKKEDFK